MNLKSNILIVMTALFFFQCKKKEIYIKHCLPNNYEGSIILFSNVYNDKMGQLPTVIGDTTFIYYSTSGIGFTKDEFSPSSSQDDICIEKYIYIQESSMIEVPLKHSFQAFGNCKSSNLSFKIDVVWKKDKPTDVTERIKQQLKTLKCQSTIY